MIGTVNNSLFNINIDQCICEMMKSDELISALNYFQTNETCQLFFYNINLIFIEYYFNSTLMFINQSSISIRAIQSTQPTTPSATTKTSSSSSSSSSTTTTSTSSSSSSSTTSTTTTSSSSSSTSSSSSSTTTTTTTTSTSTSSSSSSTTSTTTTTSSSSSSSSSSTTTTSTSSSSSSSTTSTTTTSSSSSSTSSSSSSTTSTTTTTSSSSSSSSSSTTTAMTTTITTTVLSTTAIRTTVTASALPSQCSQYTLITDGTRNANYAGGIACDNTGSFASAEWYRISGAAGTMLASSVVPSNQCGTLATGWYTGVYPSAAGTTTSGTVCYNWIVNNNCWDSNSISVTNCNGYYVFYLPPPPRCNSRYCTV